MKQKLFLLMPTVFLATNLFAQVITVKPLTQKAVVAQPVEKKVITPQPVKNQPAPVQATDLQNAVVNIVVGDDGKDYDTKLSITISDQNSRMAGYYGMSIRGISGNITIGLIGTGEYFTGDNETLPITLDASVPTGEIKQVGSLPLPGLREANLADFTNNGGSIKISIAPNGHDTWKIKNFSLTMYFNNDPASPRKITWNGFTVSQDSRIKILEFDKNFNPIQ